MSKKFLNKQISRATIFYKWNIKIILYMCGCLTSNITDLRLPFRCAKAIRK